MEHALDSSKYLSRSVSKSAAGTECIKKARDHPSSQGRRGAMKREHTRKSRNKGKQK